MTEDQIAFVDNYIHTTQEVTLSNKTREKHYYSSYNNGKEEIIVKQLIIITQHE